MKRVRQFLWGLALGLSLGTLAHADETATQPYDPLESVNRATFALNDVVDMVIVNPLVSI